jgi:hypothetical protein
MRVTRSKWSPAPTLRIFPLGLLLACLSLSSACKQGPKADAQPPDPSGDWVNNVPELRALNISNPEIAELTKAHDAGLSVQSCETLMKLDRGRQKPFTDGDGIADLLSAGASEQTVVELGRLNQLGLWAGEARVLRLGGLSDKVILAVARRRSEGVPVVSGKKLGELQNSGASEATILDFVEKGYSEQQISDYIAQRERAAGGHGFVYQGHSRRKS